MTSKENVANVMAHGDANAKISLLKKAVVSVTRQKQVLEEHNKQLQDQMAVIGEELALTQEENQQLQKKLKIVETELETERKRSSFGASMKTTWRGLSSFVTRADADGVGVLGKRSKGSSTPVNLSPEDQEKILTENESIHIQLYDLRLKYEDVLRKYTAEVERLSSEQLALQEEIKELRNLLELKTHCCDVLDAECKRKAEFVQLCYYFFKFSLNATKEQQEHCKDEHQFHRQFSLVISPSLTTNDGHDASLHEIRQELAANTLSATIAFIRTLMSGVTVLVASLRDSFGPQLDYITLCDIRCYQNRLSTLLEAHNVRKTEILKYVDELENAFPLLMTSEKCITQVQQAQGLLLSGIKEWLLLICQHIRLLVDACVRTSGLRMDDGAKSAQAVIESTTKGAIDALAAISGNIDTLDKVFCDSCSLLQGEACDSAEWLLALEHFWWECCGSSASLRLAVETLRPLLQEMIALNLNNERVRTALQFLHKSLGTLSARSWGFVSGTTHLKAENVQCASSSTGFINFTDFYDLPSPDYRELVAFLAAADRAAVCYHTQMNLTFLELAEKQGALIDSQQEVTRLALLNQQQAEEAERVREVLETQIRILSEHLVEVTSKE